MVARVGVFALFGMTVCLTCWVSQADLAQRLGARQSVNATETRRLDLSRPLALKLAKLLKLPVERFFRGEGSGAAGLDAEAEVYVLLVAGVGVEVVGGAAVELVALAEFAADEEAKGDGSEAG